MKNRFKLFSGERRSLDSSRNVAYLRPKDKMDDSLAGGKRHPADEAIMLLLEALSAAPVCETSREVVARVKIWLSRLESNDCFSADPLRDMRLDLISQLSRADATPQQTIEAVRLWIEQAEYAIGNDDVSRKRASLR